MVHFHWLNAVIFLCFLASDRALRFDSHAFESDSNEFRAALLKPPNLYAFFSLYLSRCCQFDLITKYGPNLFESGFFLFSVFISISSRHSMSNKKATFEDLNFIWFGLNFMLWIWLTCKLNSNLIRDLAASDCVQHSVLPYRSDKRFFCKAPLRSFGAGSLGVSKSETST